MADLTDRTLVDVSSWLALEIGDWRYLRALSSTIMFFRKNTGMYGRVRTCCWNVQDFVYMMLECIVFFVFCVHAGVLITAVTTVLRNPQKSCICTTRIQHGIP